MFVFAALMASSSALAQWTEGSWGSGVTYFDRDVFGYVNNTQQTVYHSGFVRGYYNQAVTESWWASNDEPFPSSPPWRSGFQTLSSVTLEEDHYYYERAVAPGKKIKVQFNVTLSFGSNGFDYLYNGVSGVSLRLRNWETMNNGTLSVVQS